MPVYYALGKAVVNEQNYLQETKAARVTRLAERLEEDHKAAIAIAGRTMAIKDVLQPLKKPRTPFEPIEYGKPLAVEIRCVYTGNNPKKSFGKKSKDMIITSAFKSITTFNEAPRAVNLLKSRVQARSTIEWGATDKGTPLAFYTPAVMDSVTFATFEVVFDNFPDDILTKLAKAIDQAAKVPVFAAQSTYLLAAGSLLNLVAKAGHSIFDGKVAFKATEKITFAHPGSEPTIAGWRILTQDTLDNDFLRHLRVGKEGRLLGADGKPYAGDFPYIVISLDGREVEAYKEFTPTAASAALLDKFFGIGEGETTMIDNALEGLKLYSDYRFRIRAEKVQKALAKIKPGDPKYDKKKKELEALKANILHEELKLS